MSGGELLRDDTRKPNVPTGLGSWNHSTPCFGRDFNDYEVPAPLPQAGLDVTGLLGLS